MNDTLREFDKFGNALLSEFKEAMADRDSARGELKTALDERNAVRAELAKANLAIEAAEEARAIWQGELDISRGHLVEALPFVDKSNPLRARIIKTLPPMLRPKDENVVALVAPPPPPQAPPIKPPTHDPVTRDIASAFSTVNAKSTDMQGDITCIIDAMRGEEKRAKSFITECARIAKELGIAS